LITTVPAKMELPTSVIVSPGNPHERNLCATIQTMGRKMFQTRRTHVTKSTLTLEARCLARQKQVAHQIVANNRTKHKAIVS
jgi:hypothetical protein